ncbi:MAG: Fic family protein [Candidatus Caenarcaniphilales bacterium]|nr:Fic family protein [Candidatus Caenarcaniphilales bacterium]
MNYKAEIPYNELPILPPEQELETKEVLKATISASRALAKLNGSIKSIPNPDILLNSITLQEAKSSSEIENIFTTNDELFSALISESESKLHQNTKEVMHYKEALWHGFNKLTEKGFLATNDFIEIVEIVKKISIGIRKTTGTKISNSLGETIYTPPEGENIIREKLANLENFINNASIPLDPLVKLAIQHYQFEAIHPFYDGNGRTGRILNILLLVQYELIDLPILYLSKYVIENKNEYYKKLKAVTETDAWTDWILFTIKGIEEMSLHTHHKIEKIVEFIESDSRLIKEKLPKIYSKDLIEILYSQPYCKIKFLEEANIAKKETASKYLKEIQSLDILDSFKSGKEVFFVNKKLVNLLKN